MSNHDIRPAAPAAPARLTRPRAGTAPAVYWMSLAQLVNWGVLYYMFGVLLLSVEDSLQQPQWIVAGAFSTALLISAVIAPTTGLWLDRGLGGRVMTSGGFVAAGCLALWALLPSLATLYLAWAGLGFSMATALYEPSFAIIGRAIEDHAERLRALAIVTVGGGLSSTVFLPLIAFLDRSMGWRGAVAVLAVVMAITTALVSRFGIAHLPASHETTRRAAALASAPPRGIPAGFASVIAIFGASTFAHAALTTTLVPSMASRGVEPTTAALLGSLMGVMQVVGRMLMMHGSLSGSPRRLATISIGLQAVGMSILALAGSLVTTGLGIAFFATGAGLTTLVRPYLVQTLFTIERSGYLNGVLARAQQLARAAGPVAAVSIGSGLGYGALFAMFGLSFTVLTAGWHAAGAAAAGQTEKV